MKKNENKTNLTKARSSLPVQKTIKLYIGGEFPRTESGRSWPVHYYKSKVVYANLCQASRKDVRSAVTAAQGAQPSWMSRSAYNRSQILYRMAEMMEGKRAEFAQTLQDTLGLAPKACQLSLDRSIQALVYFAGFADKYQQVLGAVNPVSGPHHNFTTLEPIGVVGLIPNSKFVLEDLVAQIAAPLSIGNSLVVILAQEGAALLAPLAEVFATSDLPKGLVNLLTGDLQELILPLVSHMEVQAISCQSSEPKTLTLVRTEAARNIKRVIPALEPKHSMSLEALMGFVEYKTVWHPIGV